MSYNRPVTVDAHVHVWADDAKAYPWRPIHGAAPPSIEGSAEFIVGVLDAHGVDTAVAVQSRAYGDDHRYLADSRRRFPDRFVAIAALDPREPDAPARLAELVAEGFAGLRLDPLGWGTGPLVDGTVLPLWDAAADLGLVVELLIGPDQLAALATIAGRWPGTPVVIEHMARYLARPEDPNTELLDLAAMPNVFVKISALASISGESPPHHDLWPLLRAICERFGPDRLLWGSDMPWIGPAAYGSELAVIGELPWLDEAGRAALAGGTAARVFGRAAGARHG